MDARDHADDFVAELEEWLNEKERKEHPDYRITVYCDHHLSVKMRLAESWRSIEYGETSVDVNRNRLWFCPRTDCNRCYDPTLFGYHESSGKPGTRMKGNLREQPRGNHLRLPFLYIGKVGESRRFLCPLYKCDELGPEVASSVVDEEVEIPANPLDDLCGESKKRAVEMSVFLSFAPLSGLPIDEGSPENGAQYSPDISCTILGQPYWFELGQIINEEVAEKLRPNRRKQDSGFSYDQEKPFVERIKDKATKRYKTEGAPVDLVLYFGLRLGTAATVKRLIEKHGTLLDSLTTAGPFRRVWIFDDYAKKLVWRSTS